MSGMSEWVFIPSKDEVWALAEVSKRTHNQVVVTSASQYGGDSTVLKPEDVVPITNLDELNRMPSDLIRLLDVNRASILYTTSKRFMQNEIYTAIGPVLVIVNPFKWITGLYDKVLIPRYKKLDMTMTDNPHVFAMTAGAMEGLTQGFKQSLIISGESGSGKTEATKQCLFFLAASTNKDSASSVNSPGGEINRSSVSSTFMKRAASRRMRRESSSSVQPSELESLGSTAETRILFASPVLEAFGNAKTVRNNNSSRFGKFIEIYLGPNQEAIEGSWNTTYLLEKSRVVMRDVNERNYHVFYQLMCGCPAARLEELGLHEMAKNVSKINYLCGCTQVPTSNDTADFEVTVSALERLGFSEDEVDEVLSVVASIIHLGQISFVNDAKTDGSKISNAAAAVFSLTQAAHTLGVTEAALKQALLFRTIKTKIGNRTSIMFKPYSKEAAAENRDAMSKEMYTRLFDWIVGKINQAVNGHFNRDVASSLHDSAYRNADGDGRGFIGILDIFGFEIFTKNSLEQLCINLANEALQHHFNFHIFTGEMSLYEKEGITGIQLEYKDNQDVLDVIMKPPNGVLAILNEEVKIPRGSDDGFLSKCLKAHEKSTIFLNRHKTRNFAISHYAGVVEYSKEQFVLKNTDTFSNDVAELLAQSNNDVLSGIFDPERVEDKDSALLAASGATSQSGGTSTGAGATGGSGSAKGGSSRQDKGNKMTVAKRFTLQLDQLIVSLNSTQPRYIRCIKPNANKVPNEIDKVLVSEQLEYAGVFEAVQIMQAGYPCRMPMAAFVSRFHGLGIQLAADKPNSLGAKDTATKGRRKGAVGKANMHNGGYDSIFPRRKGNVDSSNRTAKFQTTVNKEIILRLIDLLVNERELTAFSNMVVGTTQVFYRPEHSTLIERSRDEHRELVSVFLQKNVRGLMYRRLTDYIRKVFRELRLHIKNRDGELLNHLLSHTSVLEACDKLEMLLSSGVAVRHGSVSFGRGGGYGLEVNRTVVEVANELNQVLGRHSQLKIHMTAALERASLGSDYVFEEYDGLVKDLEGMKENTLSIADYPFKHDLLTFSYIDEEDCVKMAEQIEKYSVVVTLKRRLDAHSESANEGELSLALDDLIKLRVSGDIPETYCIKEERVAKKIIQEAHTIYSQYYDHMMSALSKGRMKVTKGDGAVQGKAETDGIRGSSDGAEDDKPDFLRDSVHEGSMELPPEGAQAESLTSHFNSGLNYTVDSKVLTDVFKQWDADEDLHDKSVKTDQLINIGRSLVYLREYAEHEEWDQLWEALNSNGWVQLLEVALEEAAPMPRRRSLLTVMQFAAMTEQESPSPSPAQERLVTRESVEADPHVQETIQSAQLPRPKKGSFVQLYTASSVGFFVNVETGETSFLLPKEYSFSSLIYLTHINEDHQEGEMKFYYENLETKEVTWEAPLAYLASFEMGKKILAACESDSVSESQALVDPTFDVASGIDTITAHFMAIDDYLESGDAEKVDNDGHTTTSREAQNTEIANKIISDAFARAQETERLKIESKEEDEASGGLSSLQLLKLVKANSDLYEGKICVNGMLIPSGMQGVLGREMYDLCYACLHYSCFRHIAEILDLNARNDPSMLVREDDQSSDAAYTRRTSTNVRKSMAMLEMSTKSVSLASADSTASLSKDKGGRRKSNVGFSPVLQEGMTVKGPLLRMTCQGLELDLEKNMPHDSTRLATLIQEAVMHIPMFDPEQLSLFQLARRHVKLHRSMYKGSAEPGHIENVIAEVCASRPLSDEISQTLNGKESRVLSIESSHGDVKIAQSMVAFYRYRALLSEKVFKTVPGEVAVKPPVLPKGRNMRRMSGPNTKWTEGVIVTSAVDYGSIDSMALDTFERLIDETSSIEKCPMIGASESEQWSTFLSLCEVSWMFRQAISEINSDRVNLSSIAPLEEEDEQEVTAVLALIGAIRQNEGWLSKYLEEEARKAAAASVEGGEGGVVPQGGVVPTTPTPRRTLGARSSVGGPPPPSSAVPPHKRLSGSDASGKTSASHGKAAKRKPRKGSKAEAPPPPLAALPITKLAKIARVQADEAVEASTFGRSLNEHIRVIVAEMNRVEKELMHIASISAIARALSSGAVKGEVGRLNTDSADYTSLPNVLSAHLPKVLMNQSIKLLLEDADLLIQLRKMIRFQDWDEIGRLLEPIVEVDPYFKSCHANCREELLLISMELVDYMCKKRLNAAIKAGQVQAATTECKSFSSEALGSDLLELRSTALSGTAEDTNGKVEDMQERLAKAIRDAEEAAYQSAEVRQLLFDAKVSYVLRRAAHANRWEPSHPEGTLTWGNLSMEELTTLLCTGKAAEIRTEGASSSGSSDDFLAPAGLSDSDPLMTVLGKQLVQIEEEHQSSTASFPNPPPPPRSENSHPPPPPPPDGHKPHAGSAHKEPAKKRYVVIESPVLSSENDRNAKALQVISAIEHVMAPVDLLHAPLIAAAINSVSHQSGGSKGDALVLVGIEHNNASLASGLTVVEILNYLDYLAKADDDSTDQDGAGSVLIVDDLPLESWEVKVNHGLEAEAEKKTGVDPTKPKVSRRRSSMAAPATGDVRGNLRILTRVVHPSVLEDIRIALRLSIDRRARVLLTVALLTGQTKEIQDIENEVTRQVDRFHYQIAHPDEQEAQVGDDVAKEKAEVEAHAQVREGIMNILGKCVVSEIAERVVKMVVALGEMPKCLKPAIVDPHEKPPCLYEGLAKGKAAPELTEGYLSITVHTWWAWTVELFAIRSSIIKQIVLYVKRECGIDLRIITDDRRASTLLVAGVAMRRRASAELDNFAFGGGGDIVGDDSEDKEVVDIDDKDLHDDHFEIDFTDMPYLHVERAAGARPNVDILQRALGCPSIASASAYQEMCYLRQKAADAEACLNLIHTLCSGGPEYDEEGKFLCSRATVRTEDISACIGTDQVNEEEHKRRGCPGGHYYRSARLLRLLEFAMLSLDLRKALQDEQWSNEHHSSPHTTSNMSRNVDRARLHEKAKEGGFGSSHESDSDFDEEDASEGEEKAVSPTERRKLSLRECIKQFHDLNRKFGIRELYNFAPVLLHDAEGQKVAAARGQGVDAPSPPRGASHVEHIAGVPPRKLKLDFAMVEHELQKFDILSSFPSAYRVGALQGTCMQLVLSSVHAEKLAQTALSLKKWQHQKKYLPVPGHLKGVMDKTMSVYYKAATEVIQIRRELSLLNEPYARSLSAVGVTYGSSVFRRAQTPAITNSTSTEINGASKHSASAIEDAQSVLARCNIVGSAVTAATHACTSLREGLPATSTSWERIERLVDFNCHNMRQLPFAQTELRLLQEECLSRRYVWGMVKVLHESSSIDAAINMSGALEIMRKIAKLQYDLSDSMNVLSRDSGRLVKPCAAVEALSTSAALLFHLFRAQILTECYEKLKKDEEDGVYSIPAAFDAASQESDVEDEELERLREGNNAENDSYRELLERKKENQRMSARLRRRRDNVDQMIAALSPVYEEFVKGWHDADSFAKSSSDSNKEGGFGTPSIQQLKSSSSGDLGKALLGDVKSITDFLRKTNRAIKKKEREREEIVDNRGMGEEKGDGCLDPDEDEDDDIGRKEGNSWSGMSRDQASDSNEYHSYAAMIMAREADLKRKQAFLVFPIKAVIRAYLRHREQYERNSRIATSAISSLQVHPAVIAKFRLAIQSSAYAYDIWEMKRSLKEGAAIGHPGSINYEDIDYLPLAEVLQRMRAERNGVAGEANQNPLELFTQQTTVASLSESGDEVGDASEGPLRTASEKENDSFRKLYSVLGSGSYEPISESRQKSLALKFLRMSNMLPDRVVKARIVSEGIAPAAADKFLSIMNDYDSRSRSTPDSQTGRAHVDVDDNEAVFLNKRKKVAQESLLLQRSCEIVAQMRYVVMRRDYKAGFDLLEMFITPLAEEAAEQALLESVKKEKKKYKASTKVKITSKGGTNARIFYHLVHDQCRAEFELLTMEICTGFWKDLEGTTLAPGVYLKIYTSLLMLSEQSPAMRKLCGESIRLIDQGRAGDLESALDATGGGRVKAHLTGQRKQKKRLPPLEETPPNLRPVAPSTTAAGDADNNYGYSAASAKLLSDSESDASVISRSEANVMTRPGQEALGQGKVVSYSHVSAQTDSTDLLEVIDPVYHSKHRELVKSREEATRRLAAMRSEKERVLSLLHLRELDAARKVKEEEKASIATIKRMWDNDVKIVENARADLEEQRLAHELELKEHRLAERDVATLFEHRKNELLRATARIARHHDAAAMQRRHAAHTKMRTDMGMQRLHHLLEMKDKLIRNSDDNRERFELYKATIEAHAVMYAPSQGLRIATSGDLSSEGTPTEESK